MNKNFSGMFLFAVALIASPVYAEVKAPTPGTPAPAAASLMSRFTTSAKAKGDVAYTFTKTKGAAVFAAVAAFSKSVVVKDGEWNPMVAGAARDYFTRAAYAYALCKMGQFTYNQFQNWNAQEDDFADQA